MFKLLLIIVILFIIFNEIQTRSEIDFEYEKVIELIHKQNYVESIEGSSDDGNWIKYEKYFEGFEENLEENPIIIKYEENFEENKLRTKRDMNDDNSDIGSETTIKSTFHARTESRIKSEVVESE